VATRRQAVAKQFRLRLLPALVETLERDEEAPISFQGQGHRRASGAAE
jgi:hypothetical protein